jgi:hypothetical protein
MRKLKGWAFIALGLFTFCLFVAVPTQINPPQPLLSFVSGVG